MDIQNAILTLIRWAKGAQEKPNGTFWAKFIYLQCILLAVWDVPSEELVKASAEAGK